MAAESGGETERDPLETFIDEVFEEMVRESGIPHTGTGIRHGKDPLTAALLEAAATSLSRPAHSRSSELEKALFAQVLATALAESLAPALAEALAMEIMKVLNQHAASHGGSARASAGGGSRGRRGEGERGTGS
ncbi:hypothetical protein ACFC08_31820 [Streptomyces sp. NPDC056112]|uniref:hypothetical protein n=1 Tax=unclassified Streptomyces TaxID=2593676 RepID=UPI001143EF75|nr:MULTISPECIES: hypothetical protein [unclassified Streptomyces]GED85544.1 hypothetical protein TNCT6_26290 [Streptomyces sp. 6-11-2]